MKVINALFDRCLPAIKTYLTLTLLFLSITNIHAQETTEKVDLHRIAIVEFPQKPLYKVQPAMELYSAQDSLGYCYLVIKDFHTVDPLFFVYNKDLKNYYKGIIKGSLGSSGKLIRQKYLKEKGIEFIEFEFETDNENEPNYIFARSFYINRLLIVQQYRTYKVHAQSSKSNKDHFFQSLKFTNRNKPLQQGVTVGEQIIYLIVYYSTFVAIIGGVLALIAFIIYRIARPKKRAQLTYNESLSS